MVDEIRNTLSQSDYIVYSILPLSTQKYTLGQRYNVLRGLGNFEGSIHTHILGDKTNFCMYVSIPTHLHTIFETIMFNVLPTVERHIVDQNIQRLSDIFFSFEDSARIKPYSFYEANHIDPFADLLGVYYHLQPGETLQFNISFHVGEKKSFWTGVQKFLGTYKSDHIGAEETAYSFWGGYTYISPDKKRQKDLQQMIETLLYSYAKVTLHTRQFFHTINREQLTGLFHIPTKEIQNLQAHTYRTLPYPQNFAQPQTETTMSLGTVRYRSDVVTCTLRYQDLQQHAYIIGKTGTGKSNLMTHMIKQAIQSNKGVCVLDPHGDLYETCLHLIPDNRINDVILIDIADQEFPVAYNLLSRNTEDEKNQLVSGVITAFKKLFAHSRGPRLEYILRNGLLTVLYYPNATLEDLLSLLTNKKDRERILQHLTDSLLQKFWTDEFDKRGDRQRQEVVSPITNKIGQLLSSRVVRNIFGQKQSSFSFFDAMQNNKIVLINTAKGIIGEDNAYMIGSLLLTKLQIDALKRAESQERPPMYVFIDEFQSFLTDSFRTMFAEGRKYGVSLIVAHQYLAQLAPETQQAVFGNVGSVISFGVGYQDALLIQQEMKQKISYQDLVSLPNYTAYAKIMIQGHVSDAFCLQTDLCSHKTSENKEKIIHQSQQRYAKPAPTIVQNPVIQQPKIQQQEIDIKKEQTTSPEPEHHIQTNEARESTPQEIVLGDMYTGTIKIKYNYGMFVTCGEREGLLHKNDILDTGPLGWKRTYSEGDTITVIAKDFKTIQGEQKVVRSQKLG